MSDFNRIVVDDIDGLGSPDDLVQLRARLQDWRHALIAIQQTLQKENTAAKAKSFRAGNTAARSDYEEQKAIVSRKMIRVTARLREVNLLIKETNREGDRREDYLLSILEETRIQNDHLARIVALMEADL